MGISISPLLFTHLFNTYLLHANSVLGLCLVAQSHPILCDPLDCNPPGSSVHGDSPGKHTGVGCHALLQRIVPTQGLNPGLLHCRQILYHLSHQGSPRTLEWVAYSFSSGSSGPRNRTGVSCIAGGFFTSWATQEDNRSYRSMWEPWLWLWLTWGATGQLWAEK